MHRGPSPTEQNEQQSARLRLQKQYSWINNTAYLWYMTRWCNRDGVGLVTYRPWVWLPQPPASCRPQTHIDADVKRSQDELGLGWTYRCKTFLRFYSRHFLTFFKVFKRFYYKTSISANADVPRNAASRKIDHTARPTKYNYQATSVGW